MILGILAISVLVLSAIPCGLFLLNLLIYRRLPQAGGNKPAISVLIPARNEQNNIGATLESVLASSGCEFEVIVLDDHSSDHTAQIVRDMAARDDRVRLESAPPLPPGWCGKQHACYILSKLARHELLVFLDADVRLASNGLGRLGAFMQTSGAALASGVPRQEVVTFSERLLIPLIHFILLGFLPMHLMRRSNLPALSAGCGQLFVTRREAYEACGGHSMLRSSWHDGIKLPRVFRRAGFRTELFDATDLATCRMYHTNKETCRGLGKNATEGLAAPGTIVPMSVLLLGGQVVPAVLLPFAPVLSKPALGCALLATTCAYMPRFLAARRFNQPFSSVCLHPVGIFALLLIQWNALVGSWFGKPNEWKGRSYDSSCRLRTVPGS